LRGDKSVALTPKGFDILLLLIENRNRVVSKDELMTRLWPDTFVDEANLSQNLFVLRKALGESAQDQRYIVTVRGTGYRFAEEVREVREIEDGKIEVERVQPSGSVPEKPKLTRGSRRYPWSIVITIFVIVVTVGTLYFRRSKSRASTENKDIVLAASENTIVLADFENRTGDPVFDDTLSQALLIQLEQSPFLKVLSTARVNDTLKLMNLKPGSRLTRAVAMEVCERENAKAVLAGSIAAVGREYLLAMEAFECRDGNVLASEQSRSESKEGTLDALSRTASQMRVKLGESLPSVEKFDKPLREVTTSSLEALKAFSQAAQMIKEERNEPAAAKILERVIELDPQFAMAYAYLAIANYHMGDENRAAFYQAKAYALRHRVSERERLLITDTYQLLVTGDEEEEQRIDQQWIEEFPRDYLPVHELGGIYSDLGEYDKCIEAHERAWKLEPKQPYSPSWIAGCQLALNQVEEARILIERGVQENPDSRDVHGERYETALMQDDAAALEAQMKWSETQPAISNIATNIAAALVQGGQIRAARQIMDRQITELRDQGHAEAAATTAAQMAFWESEIGDPSSAREYSAQSRNLFRGRDSSMLTALALLQAGDLKAGKSISDELAKRYPTNTAVQRIFVPLAKAVLDIHGDHPEAATRDLEPTLRYEHGGAAGFRILYIRGLICLKNGRSDEATSAFHQIIEHRGISPDAPEWTLAHLGLARAYAMQLADHNQTGDASSKPRTAYEAFFALCKQADPNFALLQEAKREYAKLQ